MFGGELYSLSLWSFNPNFLNWLKNIFKISKIYGTIRLQCFSKTLYIILFSTDECCFNITGWFFFNLKDYSCFIILSLLYWTLISQWIMCTPCNLWIIVTTIMVTKAAKSVRPYDQITSYRVIVFLLYPLYDLYSLIKISINSTPAHFSVRTDNTRSYHNFSSSTLDLTYKNKNSTVE